ncbi:MAG TPA: SRPBCC family protein [Myxococcota bacterium]|nr:SRPBCC family protein [Myxococcota bacterium]
MAKSSTARKPKSPSAIRETIDVDVPLSTAYNQWTQFEEFPRFMEGVESVRQLDDTRLFWKADVGGKTVEWQAKITEQVPDIRVAWRSVSGAKNAGAVTFDRLDDRRTRITLELEYEPEGFVENVGDFLGVVSRRAKGDLARFKDFIEKRGHETGAWRGRIPSPGRSGE